MEDGFERFANKKYLIWIWYDLTVDGGGGGYHEMGVLTGLWSYYTHYLLLDPDHKPFYNFPWHTNLL